MWETSESFGVKPLQRWPLKRNRSHKNIAHWLEYAILTKITTNAMSQEEPRDYSQQHLQERAQTEICANSVHITFPGTQLWKPKTDQGKVERRDEKKSEALHLIWPSKHEQNITDRQSTLQYNHAFSHGSDDLRRTPDTAPSNRCSIEPRLRTTALDTDSRSWSAKRARIWTQILSNSWATGWRTCN